MRYVRDSGLIRKCLAFSCFLALTAGTNTALYGQTGQPIIKTSSGQGPSPVFIDATQFTGDACQAISAAIGVMTTTGNGVVDARAFKGDQVCSVNMFGTTNPTGKLLLGNIVLHLGKTQVQPPLFQVEGVGWALDGTSSNTVIRACVATDPNCGGFALGGSPPVLWCWGHSGTCGGGTGNIFGSFTQYVSFDCSALTNCIAMQALETQEGSGCWHCQFHGWGNSGIGLQICNGLTNGCANSSFQDLYIVIDSAASACTTSAVPAAVCLSSCGTP